MIRTTVAFSEATLSKVRQIAHREHRTLGETIEELVALGIRHRTTRGRKTTCTLLLGRFRMGKARVALEDRDTIRDLIEKAQA